jgi:hypothetical protein
VLGQVYAVDGPVEQLAANDLFQPQYLLTYRGLSHGDRDRGPSDAPMPYNRKKRAQKF